MRIARNVVTLVLLSSCAIASTLGAAEAQSTAAGELAFPGAMGWAADTKGGRGGKIIRVTNLEPKGPGSLREALAADGPRIVVFEVGGAIDLGGEGLRLARPFVTIAGQTAPSPGITIIKGGLGIATHDVVLQHVRIRPGDLNEPRRSGRDIDAISTQSAYNIIVDHCTLTWATDENLSASGPRFTGTTPDEWRQGASRRLTYSNNIIAEGLANSTHSKGEHSKGSLIHDNTTDILIVGNLYAHNVERSPLFKGGVRGAIVNNLIYNPGQRAIHYNLQALEWGDMPYQEGSLTVIGNVLRGGPDTAENLPLVMFGGNGSARLYLKDNLAVDARGNPLPELGRYSTDKAGFIRSGQPPAAVPNLSVIPADRVERAVLKNAGARPWDRDPHDVRVLADTAEGRGRIIDSQEEVGGYPKPRERRREFDPALWDLDTMMPRTPDALDAAGAARGT